MAVVQMQKVAIVAHDAIKENLLDTLHKEGVIEISESKSPVTVDHTEMNFRAAELQFAISVLKDHASKETLAVARKTTTEKDIIFAAKHTDVRGIVDELHKLEERDTEGERQIKESLKLIETLEPWLSLPYSLSLPKETNSTVTIYGLVPTLKIDQIIELVGEEKLSIELLQVGTVKSQTSIVAHLLKEDKVRFEEIAVTLGWSNVDLPVLDGVATKLIEQAKMKIKELKEKREKSTKQRIRLSVELPNLVKVARFVRWLDEKQGAREAMSSTQSTVTLLGWTPRKKIPQLEQKLQTALSPVALLKVKPDEGEEVPVLLRNPTAITPFESVTNLYGYPLYSEVDPTSALTPFFALYFALCLTDAGYGAVLAAVFGTVILKKKLKIRQSKLVWTLFLGGIVAFLVGIPFGGWLGFAPEQVPAFLTKTTSDGSLFFIGQIWNLNAQSGITFLQNLSLILGLTHIFFGMFLAGMHKWIHGEKVKALWMDFTSHLLLGAVILHIVLTTNYSLLTLYGAIAIFIWGKGYGFKWFLRPLIGALGLLNFCISLLTNTLSYLRILALGLVTGALAMAVNQVAVEFGKLFPIWLAIPITIAIFLAGHLVSIALNTLGSFIHSGRLQFIEFFSQFFEGGGKAFSPFKRSTT